mgnify:CR=1 FL=1
MCVKLQSKLHGKAGIEHRSDDLDESEKVDVSFEGRLPEKHHQRRIPSQPEAFLKDPFAAAESPCHFSRKAKSAMGS